MRSRNLSSSFSRTTRIGTTAAIAAIALLATAAPVHAASPAAIRVPANAWIVTRSGNGHLQVVTGRAATELATDAANGTPTPQILSVQADQPVHALEVAGTENDPMRDQQWALNKTSFESAWSTTRGRGVKVAIVDTGVEANHQELHGSVMPGKDFVNPADDGRVDPNGHGTHVAGIIAAHANNGLGIDGAAPAVAILPVRVLDANGGGISSNVAKGIIWAADHGARVINLSLGGGKSAGMEQAIGYANSKRAVVIAAGGNNGEAGNAPMYPAGYPAAIAVAAVNSDLSHASFGNTGNYLDISAPGVDIVSLWGSSPDAYAEASGTSMATPYVSAEAALIISADLPASASRITHLLEATAIHLGPNAIFGHGLINPAAAVRAAQAPPTKPLTAAQLRSNRQRSLLQRVASALHA